ncbi:MAG TPA: response regulator transcription factor [Streptosporangiaceae bacterium]
MNGEGAAPIRVVLVDDQELVRAGFRLVLRGQPDIEVVGEAGDGREALALLSRVRADIVIMDVRMPRMDGVEAARRIGGLPEPRPRVLMLTTFDLDEYVYGALRAGASGFLLKDAEPRQLVDAVRAIHSGDAVVSPAATRRLIDRFAPYLPGRSDDRVAESLTPREREVLAQMARGLNNAEIAGELYLSEATVRTHVSRILAKLGARDRVQAIVYAYESGQFRFDR